MNYIEWALQRGAELWRAREEALKKRLSLVPEGTAQKKAAEAQLSEEEAAAQDAEMSGGAETVAEAADDPVETAAVRLGQKLGLGATQEDDGSERETAFSADLAGAAAANAALLRAREAESADNASDWIRKLLSADGRDGASAAAARGKNDFSLAQEQEVRETESFSLSLERAAAVIPQPRRVERELHVARERDPASCRGQLGLDGFEQAGALGERVGGGLGQ